jgi:hypothetical protein
VLITGKPATFFQIWAQRGVVHVAELGEEMVLDLEFQPRAKEATDESCSIIHCGYYLPSQKIGAEITAIEANGLVREMGRREHNKQQISHRHDSGGVEEDDIAQREDHRRKDYPCDPVRCQSHKIQPVFPTSMSWSLQSPHNIPPTGNLHVEAVEGQQDR